MKKIFLLLFLVCILCNNSYAQIYGQTVSAYNAVSITDTNTNHTISRAIWIGTTQSDDFYINGGWVTFQGSSAGEVIPIQATGARITSGSASPASGDVVFLY